MSKKVAIPRPYITRWNDLSAGDKQRLLELNDIVTSEYPIPQQEFTYQGHRYISLTKLASDVGISLSHLSRILTHQRHPSLTVAIRLSQALGITLDALAQRLGLLLTNRPTDQPTNRPTREHYGTSNRR